MLPRLGELHSGSSIEERLSDRSDELGQWFMPRLRAIDSPHVEEVRRQEPHDRCCERGPRVRLDPSARPFRIAESWRRRHVSK